MKKMLECPYCDGKAVLTKENRGLTYRKDSFDVVEHFYKCNNCKEEFTTTETDAISILQMHNQYREKYNIPFTEDIISIREKYELSASKMSEVLGLGINGYSNYEKGEIPTQAIGNLIKIASNPNVFKSMLEKAHKCFTQVMYDNAQKKVKYLIEEEIDCTSNLFKINQYLEPISLTGYRTPSIDKLSNIIIDFLNKCVFDFNDKLKINKLLFFTDFYCYKMTGQSMTGLSYRAIKYGPVPTNYDNLFVYLENNNIISSNWIKEINGSARETFITESICDNRLLTEAEILILNQICDNFKEMNSWDLVDLSHKEKAWIENQGSKQIIDYQKYAFDLQIL